MLALHTFYQHNSITLYVFFTSRFLKAICNLPTSRRTRHHNITTMPPTQICGCINKHSTPPPRCNCFDISISTHGTLILWRYEVIATEFFGVFVLKCYGYVAHGSPLPTIDQLDHKVHSGYTTRCPFVLFN